MAKLPVVPTESPVPAGRPALTIQDVNEPELPDSGDVKVISNTYVPEKRGKTALPVVRIPHPAQPNGQTHESDADDDEFLVSPSSSETS